MSVKKIDLMYKIFGKCERRRCKECSNFLHYTHHERSVSKCLVYGDTRSSASDWSGRLDACGMFCKEWGGVPVIAMPRSVREDQMEELPLPGQISLFGGE